MYNSPFVIAMHFPVKYRKHPCISRTFFHKIEAKNQGCSLSMATSVFGVLKNLINIHKTSYVAFYRLYKINVKDSHNFYVGVSKPWFFVAIQLYWNFQLYCFYFFPNSVLPNWGCGSSKDAAYTWTFMVVVFQFVSDKSSPYNIFLLIWWQCISPVKDPSLIVAYFSLQNKALAC